MPHSILISRTDGIGDLCLTFPALGYLRKVLPNAQIYLLVHRDCYELAKRSSWVNKVLCWEPGDTDTQGMLRSWLDTASDPSRASMVHVFPRRNLAYAAWVAGIPHRIGVSGRWYHWLYCNYRIPLSRRGSQAHEALLNISMLALSLTRVYPEITWHPMPEFEYLHALTGYDKDRNSSSITQNHQLGGLLDSGESMPRVLLHLFSNGNGREWPIAYYAELAQSLISQGYCVLVGGSRSEEQVLGTERSIFPSEVVWQMGLYDLSGYIKLIEGVDFVVASGTGPLHIAGLAGVPVIGLFPPRCPINSRRWGPVGMANRVRVMENSNLCPVVSCTNQDCVCMRSLLPEEVLGWIKEQANTTVSPGLVKD